MGMPITVEVVDKIKPSDIDKVFDYFRSVDDRFSTYKKDSEISKVNRGLAEKDWSGEMKEVMRLCDLTKEQTNGYFDIEHEGKIDPSGLVKGWAIYNAANLLRDMGLKNYYIEAGGDIEVSGLNQSGQPWTVGIRNPFNTAEIVKAVILHDQGMATSGNYIRGEHIYNPKDENDKDGELRSLSVIGPNVYEADRYVTAAFAMGKKGIYFIESLEGFEGYMIDNNKTATLTTRFGDYVATTA